LQLREATDGFPNSNLALQARKLCAQIVVISEIKIEIGIGAALNIDKLRIHEFSIILIEYNASRRSAIAAVSF
jgi:hypothetical protein